MAVDRDARARRILETIRDIPPGAVASYGQIAEIAGIPRGARQVGYVLRHLSDGHDVPWHRVVRSSGRIAFDRDSPEYREQTDRLRLENVTLIDGRIDMQQFRWRLGLDELLWKPSHWDAG